MHSGFFIVIVVILTITFPAAYSTPTNTTATSSAADGPDLQLEVLANAVNKHPELKEWYFRLKDRIANSTDAKDEDVDEVRGLLKEVQTSIYEFVTGPEFNDTASMYIEAAITLARPVIAALPLRELREIMKIVESDPDLMKVAHSGKDDVLGFLSTLDVTKVKGIISHGIAPGMADMILNMIPHQEDQ